MNTELLQTTAALPAADPEIGANADSETADITGQVESSPLPEGFEFDIANPSYGEYLKDDGIDLFVRLEELFPDDMPGQLSGFILRIIEGGRCITLQAESGSVEQPYGNRNYHLLGYLNHASIRRFVEEAETGAPITIGLREFDQKTCLFNGAVLSFTGGDTPELRLCFGVHCFGALRGELMARFLGCVRTRLDLGGR
jgi:hypothetical protein